MAFIVLQADRSGRLPWKRGGEVLKLARELADKKGVKRPKRTPYSNYGFSDHTCIDYASLAWRDCIIEAAKQLNVEVIGGERHGRKRWGICELEPGEEAHVE